ncbi:MAG TPA: response regulator [Polyangia bacterium]|nr:response regulator [Polyangia bacterium]
MTARAPRSVLVVDDSSLMRRLIGEIVSADPDLRVVDVAENGKIALQKVRQHKPDCVLLDLEMPELSGLDTMRRLRLRSPVKIVVLSHLGHEGPRLRAEALRLGAVDVIDKPTGAVSRDLGNTRGALIRQALRRALDLPPLAVPAVELPAGGASATASMLSADVKGLGALCERVEAAALLELCNENLALIEKVIKKHDGVIDTHLGGSTLAAFGVPEQRADHAARAVAAASELRAALEARRAERRRPAGAPEPEPEFDLGITIVTGLVVAGELGPARGRRYRTLGGASEAASRLGRLREGYGADLVIDGRTLGALPGTVAVRRLDVVQVEAGGEPITLYELLPPASKFDAGALAAYARGMELYEAGQFAKAGKAFDEALQRRPGDGAAARLRARCQALLRAPAGGWRGVWALDGAVG